MLRSSEAALLQQQRYSVVGIAAARRAWLLQDPRALLPALTLLQGLAAQTGAAGVGAMLAEQNIDAPEIDPVNTQALAGVASDGRPLGSLLEQADTVQALELMAVTQIADAGRVAAGLSITSRRNVGWVRMVTPPCCPRCAILAGQYYRWNSGFQRHPGCDCRHIPTQEDVADDVRTDPKALFDSGQVNGVTRAEQKAISQGADINQVVNARRSLYMDEAGHRFTREGVTSRGIAGRQMGGLKKTGTDRYRSAQGPRPTPEQIYRTAGDDQAAALRALKKFGYIF